MVTVCPGLEPGDEPPGLTFGVVEAGEVVGAQVVVWLSGDHDAQIMTIIACATTTIAFLLR